MYCFEGLFIFYFSFSVCIRFVYWLLHHKACGIKIKKIKCIGEHSKYNTIKTQCCYLFCFSCITASVTSLGNQGLWIKFDNKSCSLNMVWFELDDDNWPTIRFKSRFKIIINQLLIKIMISKKKKLHSNNCY